ncbi:hypothetical protein D3C87_1851540 [compost metagenome]
MVVPGIRIDTYGRVSPVFASVTVPFIVVVFCAMAAPAPICQMLITMSVYSHIDLLIAFMLERSSRVLAALLVLKSCTLQPHRQICRP